jgi:hypothetical protein
MNDKPAVPAEEALHRFLEAVEQEAKVNPAFKLRLVNAMGVQVVFSGEEDLEKVSARDLARRYDEATFRRLYGGLKPAQIKTILLAEPFALATREDLKGKTGKPALIDLLVARAKPGR